MITIKEQDGCPIKLWVEKIEDVETGALEQLKQLSRLPFVMPHIAVMPDVHSGIGACIGSVIPTTDCIIPSAVGVDIGCGCLSIKTNLKTIEFLKKYEKLSLHTVRELLETVIPVGRQDNGNSSTDTGSWENNVPQSIKETWNEALEEGFERIVKWIYPEAKNTNSINHLGTLGTGNHFIEFSSDQCGDLWLMIHSGSRGVGNKLGVLSIRKAKELMNKYHIKLENPDFAYFPRDTKEFQDYMEVVEWCQKYARLNRIIMANKILEYCNMEELLKISCHHNYVRIENHNGKNLYITRKGAIRAGGKFHENGTNWSGDWGIIPGSMGTKSYIVKGKGNKDSFFSASHGAGRTMSRGKARQKFTIKEVMEQTIDVECKKNISIVDEIPGAYKDIDKVMGLQSDLVEIVYKLKPILCIKG